MKFADHWIGRSINLASPESACHGCGKQVRIVGRPITSVLGAKSRFWAADGSAVGVEELALLHYATPEAGGWKGARGWRSSGA